ncbi:hypothetical protein [Shewanella sp. 10N.286.52.A9]|uniref:hypothetical protein n=1 Tax=Shewanella sp. 10N.286.52.A9 TaxID=3229711 RepID=UPI003552F607
MFSNILQAQLINPLFLNQALQRLDVFLNEEMMNFSAEDVICTITDNQLGIDELSTEIDRDVLISEAIQRTPVHLKRLNKALSNKNFVYETLSCEFDYEKELFPLAIIDSFRFGADSYDHFEIKSMVNRLKTKFNISHTKAKNLIARVCGLKTGNEVQRFADMIPRFLSVWMELLYGLSLKREFYQIALKQANAILPNFPKLSSINVRYENDVIVSKMVCKESNIDLLSELREFSSLKNSFYRNIYDTLIEGKVEGYSIQFERFFYHHLYDFAICQPISSNLKQVESMQCIFLSLIRECLTNSITRPLLYSKRNVLKNKRGQSSKAALSISGIQYYWYAHIIMGSKMYPNEAQAACLDHRMKALNNEFRPTMYDDLF